MKQHNNAACYLVQLMVIIYFVCVCVISRFLLWMTGEGVNGMYSFGITLLVHI
jgi:hypothetical protein